MLGRNRALECGREDLVSPWTDSLIKLMDIPNTHTHTLHFSLEGFIGRDAKLMRSTFVWNGIALNQCSKEFHNCTLARLRRKLCQLSSHSGSIPQIAWLPDSWEMNAVQGKRKTTPHTMSESTVVHYDDS